MALISGFVEKLFGKVESEEYKQITMSASALDQSALEMSIEQMKREIDNAKYNALADQYRGMQNTPSGFQNALTQQSMRGTTISPEQYAQWQQNAERAQAMLQAGYEQKFKEEALIKGAVSSEELDSVAYSLSLEEVRTIWLAAFGSRWVAQESMEGDHRLMFQRLFQNDQFESATVTDPTTRTFKIRYRLKGT